MTREEISQINSKALIVDGFDKAIVGMAEGWKEMVWIIQNLMNFIHTI